MSSAILYVAIVAIWIGVLVPRWLRHEHAHDGHLRLRRFSLGGRQRASDAAARAGFSEDGHPRYTRSAGDVQADRPQKSTVTGPRSRDFLSEDYNSPYVSVPVNGNAGGMAQPYETGTVPSQVRSYGWSAEEYLRQERRHERDPRRVKRPGESPAGSHHDGHRDGEPVTAPAAPAAPATPAASTGDSGERRRTAARQRRARMIRGRRRMLCMLLVLTVAVVCLAFLGLAAWWIAVPPVVLLAGYLLLLREAAHADAEAREQQARERSAAMAQRAREARQAADAQPDTHTGSSPASPAWPAHETPPAAEIIDISARVRDQLYDQYADARLRAVGD